MFQTEGMAGAKAMRWERGFLVQGTSGWAMSRLAAGGSEIGRVLGRSWKSLRISLTVEGIWLLFWGRGEAMRRLGKGATSLTNRFMARSGCGLDNGP